MTEPCQWLRLTSDGTVVLRVAGAERNATLNGVVIPDPSSPARALVEQRLATVKTDLRCDFRPPAPGTGRPTVLLRYLAWRDKSGDVWQDVSASLLEIGAVRVTPDRFPERDEYLRLETSARDAGVGIWKP